MSSTVHKYSALREEFEKLSAAGEYAKDFMAGVDPFGVYTSRYGQEAQRAGVSEHKHTAKRLIGTAGGIVGGGVVIPTAVSGIMGAVKGAKGGLGGAAAGFLHGAQKPMKSLGGALKARGYLARAAAAPGGRTAATAQEMAALKDLAGGISIGDIFRKGSKAAEGGSGFKLRNMLSAIPSAMRGQLTLTPAQARMMHEGVKAPLRSALTGLGMAAGVGGAGAYMQYGKGRQSEQEYRQREQEALQRANMQKRAFDESDRKKLMVPLALGGGALMGGGLYTLSRPGLRAEAIAALRGLGKGGARAVSEKQPLHPVAVENARAIAKQLRAAGIDPKKARIGVGATGGTGKSTLAKALSKELGMDVNDLDLIGSSIPKGRDIPKYLKKNPLKQGVIAEQSHLLTQVNPEQFDVMVHLEKPYEQIEKQILKRGRGAKQIEFYDYPKMGKVIREAFEGSKGDVQEVAPGVRFKIRPKEGWGAEDILRAKAKQKGVELPEGVTREQLVHAAATGELPTVGGILPYVRGKRIGALSGSVAGGAGLAGTGAYLHETKPKQPRASL